MDIQRYSLIENKYPREIVLLKGRPCQWGQCSFCDYIHDNSEDEVEMIKINEAVLEQVTGRLKHLEVINSGSCFEMPRKSLEKIKEIIESKGIEHLYLESHYSYRHRLDEMREFFGIPITFKCGIETFDDYFRNKVLRKGVIFQSPEEVAQYFSSICLMVGIQGQTQAMIERDMALLEQYFERGCINIYINNSTAICADESLIRWFREAYGHLEARENIEILWNNTDFGVGGDQED